MYQPSNPQQQQYRNNNNNSRNGGGGIISQLCPNMLGYYIDSNINSIPKLLNHTLYITIVCNIMLLIRSYSHSGTSQLLGYSTLFISFLLFMQSICVYFIINNKNGNNNSTIRLSPNQFMIGMTLGLCMGGTIISFMISKSYRNSSKQCNSLHHYTMMMSGSHNNTTNTNNNGTNINNQIMQEEEWELLLRHDPIIQYLCSITVQKIMKRRSFWSSWLFWCNLLNTILIAYGRPELTTDIDNSTSTSQSVASMYMGVPTNETSNNNNNTGSSIPPPMPPSSYNNPNGSAGSVFSGNYATIPEVRPGGGPAPPSSSSTLLKTGDPAAVMNV